MCGACHQPGAFFPAPLHSELEPPSGSGLALTQQGGRAAPSGSCPAGPGSRGPRTVAPRAAAASSPSQGRPNCQPVNRSLLLLTLQCHRVIVTSSRREPPKLRRHAYVILPASSHHVGVAGSRRLGKRREYDLIIPSRVWCMHQSVRVSYGRVVYRGFGVIPGVARPPWMGRSVDRVCWA